MGARSSVAFKQGDNVSVVLFDHWGGEQFALLAQDYLVGLKKEINKDSKVYPLYRLEPNTVMVDFIRHLTKNMGRVESSFYLGKTEEDGDNSDYGHTDIILD